MNSNRVSAAWHAGMCSPGETSGLYVARGEAEQLLIARELDQVPVLIEQAHAAARQGCYVVGGLAYEAAPAFDASLAVHPLHDFPLLEFHVFQAGQVEKIQPAILNTLTPEGGFFPWLDSLQQSAYQAVFSDIRQAILEGEFYQINFTTRLRAISPNLDPWLFFQHLYLTQPAGQSLFLRGSNLNVISLSPELFFSWDGTHLQTAPMKGTRRPSAASFDKLSDSEKDRAENVMIVDLLRNDIAKVCKPRSVQVRSLFDVMHLPTVDQMTSSISGLTRPDVQLTDLFAALFPCGSVTGAPKAQAMLRISEWEAHPRKFYCGALGVLSPGGRAHFNVPIRTVIEQAGELEYGVGSGITWYSTSEDEKREWGQKTEFLRNATCDFQVLETLRLEAGHYGNLDLHLARMAQAADHFAYPFSQSALEQLLAERAAAYPTGIHRARLLLNARGDFNLDIHPLDLIQEPVQLRLASEPMRARRQFLIHKTTHRLEYEYFQGQAHGAFDVLLFNPQGNLTETCRFNLVLRLDGQWHTPKICEGTASYLLPGVLRTRLLMENTLRETVLTLHDLKRAQDVFLINSLRGWVRVGEVIDQDNNTLYPGTFL